MIDRDLGAQFGRESAAAVLQRACRRVGMSAAGAQLVRLGENAIFRLADVPVIVRIGRNMGHWDDAMKEVAVSRWLATAELRAARTCSVDQPLEVDGHPVTFWRFVEGRRGNPDDVGDLGRILRRLHHLPRPDHFDLPPEDVLGRVRPRIERAQISRADRAFLLKRLSELRTAVEQLAFPLPRSVIHGDAHVQNLLVDDGAVTLIDFERFAYGQPEWDLSMTATEYLTAKWWTPTQYEQFAQAYGFDITSWDGFEVLRQVHEIKMTTWLMQNVAESKDIKEEYDRRMQTIATGRNDLPWTPF